MYDMLAMLYAPERGEIITRSLTLPPDTDTEAATVALRYFAALCSYSPLGPPPLGMGGKVTTRDIDHRVPLRP